MCGDYASVFEDADLLHVKFDVGDLVLDVDFIHGDTFNLIGETVDADERLLDLPGFRVGEVNRSAQISCLAELSLVLVREGIAFIGFVELRLVLHEMRREGKT